MNHSLVSNVESVLISRGVMDCVSGLMATEQSRHVAPRMIGVFGTEFRQATAIRNEAGV